MTIDCDIAELRQFLNEHGYLYIKSAIPSKAVLEARRIILADMKKNGYIEDGTESGIKSSLNDDEGPSLLGRQDLSHAEPVLKVIENGILYDLVEGLWNDPIKSPSPRSSTSIHESKADNDPDNLSPPLHRRHPKPKSSHPRVLTLPFKWLRAVSKNLCTGPHLDRVYLGAGSQNLLTIWTPMGNLPAEQGGLCMADKSHNSAAYERLRKEYGLVPAGKDGTKSGWITEMPEDIVKMYGISEDIRWVTADFQAGDIVVFGLDVLHMTVNNSTSNWRISCETRWQPLEDPYPPFYT
ncbi:hypothetical protein HDV05_001091 [Chytridiales sp. JEL 0842]|nr:hypothetical protein HDV05_001091 [Chytridiales sp. JEL 0842]